MQRIALFAIGLACIISGCYLGLVDGQRVKTLVAHRGASAYAPEHTLAAYRLAIDQGADYVEQDLAVTKDGALICLHDESLERTTNVANVFPDRAVVDSATARKQWLAVNFTLAEIKRLDAGSWFDARFSGERVPTWEEAVETVGTRAGLYPELKNPALYTARGIDQTALFIASVKRLGLHTRRVGDVIVQSFDDQPLRTLARALPSIPRVYLIEARDGAKWLSNEGLREISRFATGIGPAKALLDHRADVVEAAHMAGLTVTPYTFTTRAPAPDRFKDVRDEMQYYLTDLGVDALFTDDHEARKPRLAFVFFVTFVAKLFVALVASGFSRKLRTRERRVASPDEEALLNKGRKYGAAQRGIETPEARRL